MIARTVTWEMDGPSGADAAIWVDTAKLDRLWQRAADAYIGSGGSEHAIGDRYTRVGLWILAGRPLKMLQIAVSEEGELSFIDGRHRFAWLRDHGAKSVQVQLHSDHLEYVTSMLSTGLKITKYFKLIGHD